MIYSNMTFYALLVGVVIPLLVGLLTKLNASSGIKSILNLGFTALGTALVTFNQTTVWNWKTFAINFGLGWAVSIGTYYGFYKPTGVAGTVAKATPNFGVG